MPLTKCMFWNTAERMKHKWQFFVVGLLLGFLISGIAILTVNRVQRTSWLASMSVNERMEFASTPMGVITQMEDERNLGKIDLNRATVDDLMTLPNIGETRALAIITFRETYGDFENINELLYVSGIGPEIYSRLEDLVYVQ